ncbi:hypothetical protein [Pseudomonas aeruginosa]|uniref:hypothetical protein n=1 Tax=Pseudomonas aeruginosa TaxID=287 RepID=UPI0039C2472B
MSRQAIVERLLQLDPSYTTEKADRAIDEAVNNGSFVRLIEMFNLSHTTIRMLQADHIPPMDIIATILDAMGI